MKIALVCRVNLCRSPMAEAVFNDRLGRVDDIQTRSAGLDAMSGQERPACVMEALRDHGYGPLSSAFSRRVDPVLLRWADLVLVMEQAQRQTLLRLTPIAAGKVWRLGHWLSQDIADPDALTPSQVRDTLRTVESCVESWVPHLQSHLRHSDHNWP